VSPLERELTLLARKAHEQPKLLLPSDLQALRDVVGDAALDYALVLSSFHFINRIADLLSVDPEMLPEAVRRFEPLRKAGNRLAALLFRRTMDLDNRRYEGSFAEAVEDLAAVVERITGTRPGAELEPLRSRPKIVEAIRLMLEEKEQRSSLDREVLVRIHHSVEKALAQSRDDVEGLHPRPADPVDAFAFVGTRYASRTTPAMIAALRDAGYDDLGILDLAIAIADANQWARLHRLVGLPPELGYLGADPSAQPETLA